MTKERVLFRDLGKMDYQQAWDLQESLLQENIDLKTANRRLAVENNPFVTDDTGTLHRFLFVEHSPVYTLGKSGKMANLLADEKELEMRGIQFIRTNRGGDITFHGPGQVVGYPILDLEKFGTDIGKYLRNLEEVIIRALAGFGIRGERSAGETGVWIEPDKVGSERKICAIGVRCSRWITMHGFALNVNTNLAHFDQIIPCGIRNKRVSSMQQELGEELSMEAVKGSIRKEFESVFGVEAISWPQQQINHGDAMHMSA